MSSTLNFEPDTDIPDLASKVIFITGGTGGLGAESIIHLAKHRPHAIYFSGRSKQNAAALITRVLQDISDANVVFIKADLASLTSVKASADVFLAQSEQLDVLICNAGISGVPIGLTEDGYEIQFGTNHLGHALLAKKLLPLLLASGDGRIVLVGSQGFDLHPPGGILFDTLKTPQDLGIGGPWKRYGQSKLANMLYARELAKRHSESGLTAVSVHPGFAPTGLLDLSQIGWANKMLLSVASWHTMLSLPEGAYNQVWAATADKNKIKNGQYYVPVGQTGTHTSVSRDEEGELGRNLWEWTERELAAY